MKAKTQKSIFIKPLFKLSEAIPMAKAESKPLSKVRISLTLKVAMCVTERVENGTISDGFSRHGSVPSFSSSASSSSQWSAAQISHVDLPPVPTTNLPPLKCGKCKRDRNLSRAARAGWDHIAISKCRGWVKVSQTAN